MTMLIGHERWGRVFVIGNHVHVKFTRGESHPGNATELPMVEAGVWLHRSQAETLVTEILNALAAWDGKGEAHADEPAPKEEV